LKKIGFSSPGNNFGTGIAVVEQHGHESDTDAENFP
jgi:hypothetical protein